MIPRADLYRLLGHLLEYQTSEDPAARFARWVRGALTLSPDLDLQDLATVARILAGEAWEGQEPEPKVATNPWADVTPPPARCAGSGLEVIDPATGNYTDRAKVVEVVGGGENGPSFAGGRARCPECRVFVAFDSSGRLLAHRPCEVAPLGREVLMVNCACGKAVTPGPNGVIPAHRNPPGTRWCAYGEQPDNHPLG